MLRLLAEAFDDYIARKFEQALRNRSYTTTSDELEEVKKILSLGKEELFLLNTPLPTSQLTTNLKLVAERDNHTVYQSVFRTPHNSSTEVNNYAYIKLYQSKLNPHGPIILILPGWMTYKEEKYYAQPLGKMLLEAGVNYLFYCLPYHMERTPKGYLSGELAVSGDILRTLQAFRQGISECRTILTWVKEEIKPTKLGILGISLGGWFASHLIHLDPHLDLALLMIPAINPTSGLWQTKIATPVRRDLIKSGLNQEQYQSLFAPLDPANYQPLIDPQKIMLIRARYDQCVPTSALDRFNEVWKGIKVRTYRHGHFSIMRTTKPIGEIIRFISNET